MKPVFAQFCRCRIPGDRETSSVLFVKEFRDKAEAIAWGKTWWEALSEVERRSHFMRIVEDPNDNRPSLLRLAQPQEVSRED